MQMSLDQFGISQLTPVERLELISLIWDSIPEVEADALPEWHQREVERRVAAADANPEQGVPLARVRSRLLGES